MDQGQELKTGGSNDRSCATEGCTRPRHAKGMCSTCYKNKAWSEGKARPTPEAAARATAKRQANNVNPVGHWGKWKGVSCSTEGCEKPAKAKGLCNGCYSSKAWAEGKNRYPAETLRNNRLKSRYGITSKDYDEMLENQNGCCAICKQPPNENNTNPNQGGKLCVDHCHDTKKVRGLLCNDCNLAIGYAKTESTMLSAAEYIRHHS